MLITVITVLAGSTLRKVKGNRVPLDLELSIVKTKHLFISFWLYNKYTMYINWTFTLYALKS